MGSYDDIIFSFHLLAIACVVESLIIAILGMPPILIEVEVREADTTLTCLCRQ